MTTLVTGATGFVGSAVVRRLLDAGHDVRVLAKPASRRDNLEGLSVDVVEGDLRDSASLVAAVKGCETLFHVAADYRLWVRRPNDLYEANVSGSLNLLRAAADAGVERMVYTSSVATLGLNADGTSSTETTPIDGDKIIGAMARAVPMKRVGTPTEVASAVIYFCSEEAAFVTGQTLSVSGGLTMS